MVRVENKPVVENEAGDVFEVLVQDERTLREWIEEVSGEAELLEDWQNQLVGRGGGVVRSRGVSELMQLEANSSPRPEVGSYLRSLASVVEAVERGDLPGLLQMWGVDLELRVGDLPGIAKALLDEEVVAALFQVSELFWGGELKGPRGENGRNKLEGVPEENLEAMKLAAEEVARQELRQQEGRLPKSELDVVGVVEGPGEAVERAGVEESREEGSDSLIGASEKEKKPVKKRRKKKSIKTPVQVGNPDREKDMVGGDADQEGVEDGELATKDAGYDLDEEEDDHEASLIGGKGISRTDWEAVAYFAEEGFEGDDDGEDDREVFGDVEQIAADDPVGLYLRQMAQTPLLTAQDEIDLAMRIELGKVIREGKEALSTIANLVETRPEVTQDQVIGLSEQLMAYVELVVGEYDRRLGEGSGGMSQVYEEMVESFGGEEGTENVEVVRMLVEFIEELNPEVVEEVEMVRGADAQAAREHLGKANTRLVVSIAKRYMSRGLPFLDLIQEGNVGLMRAVDKYDYRRGNKFSTYATWWIRQGITRALAQKTRTIRLPLHMTERIREMYKKARALEQELGRRPTPEEIAVKMETGGEDVRELMNWSRQALSLHTPVGDDGDSEFGDFIEDEDSPSPPEAASQGILVDQIDEMLAELTPRQSQILRLRFGLGGGEPHTLEEIANKFGLSRERIRQLEKEALRRLRHPRLANKVRDYLV